jgi:hypothetical protein
MPNITTYIPTYLSINNLQGGFIAVYDDVGAQYLYQNTTDGLIELPYNATGTWSYKIGRYGFRLISNTFNVDPNTGGTIIINPSYTPDLFVQGNVTAVSAYNTFSTTQNIYDYLSFYRTTSAGLGYGDLNLYSATLDVGSTNIIFSDTVTPVFNYNGSRFLLNSTSLSGNPITTTGSITLSGNARVSNITINANVSSQTLRDLGNVSLLGTLTYNTNVSAAITYTNTDVSKVVNNGSANVLIKRINSTISDATDPEITTYIPTYLSINNLQGGFIAVYDNVGSQYLYQNTTDGLIELPSDATGTWSYKIGRYGFKLISDTFDVNPNIGGTVIINPSYVPDLFVLGNVTAVSAYTEFTTTQNIYDYLSFYRATSAGLVYGDLNLYSATLDVGSANIIFSDTVTPAFNYNGSRFLLNSTSLSGNPITTTGGVTLSGNSRITNITLNTNVSSATPRDLNSVSLLGTLTYNTNISAAITYTNTSVSKVVNNGSANVLIKRVNSTISDATDPEIQNYAPTIINVVPNGGSVAIFDDTGVKRYFITSNTTVELPFGSTGTWSYKAAKYGFTPIRQDLIVNQSTGNTYTVSPIYSVNTSNVDSLSNVVAYTNLNTTQKMYDYLSYYETTSSGIDYELISKAAGSITFAYNLTLDATASTLVDFTSNVITLKSSGIDEDIILAVNGIYTEVNGALTTLIVKLRSNNLDSELGVYNVNSVTLFPTISDREGNTNPGPTFSTGVYRFKYGNTTLGVVLSGTIYARVDVNTILLYQSPIIQGNNILDLGVQGQLSMITRNQEIINTGVQKSSILVPHSTNL